MEHLKEMRGLYATDKWEKEKRRMELEEAMQKALAKGETRKSLAIAQKMLLAGLPDFQIMQFTGLTKEQINSLKN